MNLTETIKTQPFYIDAKIMRVDDDKREVEGYAFVNEMVDGEGGLKLKRTAMEGATADYMKWGNLREMHQPSAVGKVSEAKWDDKGLFIRASVVDDNAWKKVKSGVYSAFSIGVAAKVMRGKDVEVCKHIETSLVDRPKDEGALITAYRLDESEEVETEIQRSYEELVTEIETLSAAEVTRAELLEINEKELTETLQRVQGLESDIERVTTQLSVKETELAESLQRYETLKASPVPLKPPVRVTEGLIRVFEANAENETAMIEPLKAEYKEIIANRGKTQDEQMQQVNRVTAIKRELASYGIHDL